MGKDGVPAHVGYGRTTGGIALVIAVLTLAVFWPATGHDFINFDDPDYVTQNPAVLGGLSLDGLRFAFNIGHTGNWIPLTWLSHMLDVSLFGVRPAFHHLHSIVLHALNAVLLFVVLLRLRARAIPAAPAVGSSLACGFVALLFAVHPLRLESVVWISERKDLLAALFWLLTLLAYLRYTKRPGVAGMSGVTLLFALGLMAKPMLVSLPLVLCVLDVWPLERMGFGRAGGFRRPLLEKLPLFALAAGSAALAVLAQSRSGALSSIAAVNPGDRVAGAIMGYAGYLFDLLWPTRLAVFYPFPADGWSVLQVLPAAAVLAGISVAAFTWRARYPWLAVGWAWYLISAAPVIGLVKIGQQAGADRYTYLPLIGPTAALVWVAVLGARRLRLSRGSVVGAGVIVIAALALSTRSQLGYWQDSLTLFTRALEVTKDNHVAHYSLSLEYAGRGELERALFHGHEAVRIYPLLYDAYLHLAETHLKRGEADDALFLVGLALGQQPDNAAGYFTLGRVYLESRQPLEAVAAFEDALARAPNLARAHYNLGVANELLGRADQALENYASAVRLTPDDKEAWFELGRLSSIRGRSVEAREALKRAAALPPAEPGVVALLALVHLELREHEAAEACYRDLVAMNAPGAQHLRELLDASGSPGPP